MVDPVSNEAVSKIAESQGASGAGEAETVGESESADGPSFQEVLDGKQGAEEAAAAEEAERASGAEGPEGVDEVGLEELDDLRASSTDEGRPVKFEKFVDEISEDKQEIDRMLEAGLGGENLDQKELLEMQALIYSYSKKVELTSKVVEKGTGGLKQMMQMRV